MKKIIKIFSLIVLAFIINQTIVFLNNDEIKNGFYKVNGTNRFLEDDVIIFNNTLKLNNNIITLNDKKVGIIQLYFGKKLIFSNLNGTKWYIYENKGAN